MSVSPTDPDGGDQADPSDHGPNGSGDSEHVFSGLPGDEGITWDDNRLSLGEAASSALSSNQAEFLPVRLAGGFHLGESLTGRLDLSGLAPLTLAVEEASQISASLHGLIQDAALTGSAFSALDASIIPSSLGVLSADIGSLQLPAETLIALETAGSLDISSALAPLASESFATALQVPGLSEAGSAFGTALDAISASTSMLFQEALQIPDLATSIRSDIGTISDVLGSVAGSLDLNGVVGPDLSLWTKEDALFSSVAGLLTTPSFSVDVAGVLSGFDRLTMWPEATSVMESVLGNEFAGTLSRGLSAELPALVRRTVVATPAPVVEDSSLSQDTPFVRLAVAWVQGWAARNGVVLSSEATLNLVVTVAVALAGMAAGGLISLAAIQSSTADADRIIESQTRTRTEVVDAIDRQTEVIERLPLPSPLDVPSHLVIEHVDLRSEPSGDAPCVGRAHPNQRVSVEVEEKDWSRIMFVDEVESHTVTGWVQSAALRDASP